MFVCEQQVKLNSPDYIDCNTEEAVQDFMKRIKCYENSYEPLDEVLDRSEPLHFHTVIIYIFNVSTSSLSSPQFSSEI